MALRRCIQYRIPVLRKEHHKVSQQGDMAREVSQDTRLSISLLSYKDLIGQFSTCPLPVLMHRLTGQGGRGVGGLSGTQSMSSNGSSKCLLRPFAQENRSSCSSLEGGAPTVNLVGMGPLSWRPRLSVKGTSK